MDPISNSDRLVRLLRQQLEERSRAKKTRKGDETQPVRQSGLDQVRAIASEMAQTGGQDHQLRRLLVEQLLADQFGTGLVNEPRFQQVVDQVSELMSEDDAVSALLAQATADLRKKGV